MAPANTHNASWSMPDLVPTSERPDPQRDHLLRLLAKLNAQAKPGGGISFGCVIDGHGNTYFQSPEPAHNPIQQFPGHG